MKKNSFAKRIWHCRRAANERRRRNRGGHDIRIRIWHGEDVQFAISSRAPTKPPAIMCLERNTVQVTEFLERLRRRLLRPINSPTWLTRKRGSALTKVKGFLDFAAIDEMSTSAGLVMAAEYERVVSIMGEPPPLINLDEWRDDVFLRLWQLGFFSTIGIAPTVSNQIMTANEDVMTLKFLSGSNAEETEAADKMLVELGRFLDPGNELPEEIQLPLTTALSEAMINVRRHAYPEDHKFRFKHINRWWLTGSADRARRKLTVVIYDQGATIPITYSKLSESVDIREWILSRVGLAPKSDNPFAEDGARIAAAAKFGNTQTGKSYRGKGLPDMQNAIDCCENGRLMILSRGGRYVYEGKDRTSIASYPCSIGGTLIEWTITLPSDTERAEQHGID
ncbi:ATP-binding protein [Agrobacterium vitis]|uniref:ATP-binding protein n=1 Tax=Allorhizobium ampelinum TaxID=3025782 RepID=UPI001F381A4B|nr:ATP-binding protein [Allorhizobium ampelinum]MCF1450157.1 ATP-binding protein [Allorhizobium ampelinum]